MAGSGSAQSWALLAALGVAAAARAVGCGPVGPPEPTDNFDRAALLASLVDEVYTPAFTGFATDAASLRQAVDAWAASGDGGALSDARVAFTEAMFAWQQLEVMQLGPLASSLATDDGEDLRDQLYSWPTVNPCTVDQALVANEFLEPGFFDAQLVLGRGLDALEYVLFHDGPDNQCSPQLAINTDGTWDAVGDVELAERRRAYAAAAARDVEVSAQAAGNVWTTGGFGLELRAPGEPGSRYLDAAEALDAIYEALFFVETVSKDLKLGVPMGLVEGAEGIDAEALELLWAGGQMEAVGANLDGFRAVFDGGAVGFDDFLIELDQQALSDAVFAALDDIQLAIDDAPRPLRLRLDDPAAVAVFTEMQVLGDLLKGDLALVLNLTIPSDAAGDAD